MTNLELLRIAENQDEEAYEQQDFESNQNDINKLKQNYCEFYDDIKQESKYIKEDW